MGLLAYDRYVAKAGGRSLATRDPLPEWAALSAETQAAWVAAAGAVVDDVLLDGEDDDILGGLAVAALEQAAVYNQLAAQLDRGGVNKLVRSLRRARNVSFGVDE
jgi:hypothetical protein